MHNELKIIKDAEKSRALFNKEDLLRDSIFETEKRKIVGHNTESNFENIEITLLQWLLSVGSKP